MEKTQQDPIKLLIDWVQAFGGTHNVVVKENESGVRGLYAGKSFNLPGMPKSEEHQTLVKIPNQLMISSYHVKNQYFNEQKQVKYAQIFDLIPEIFDPKYKYKPNSSVKERIDNEYGEYYQLSFFLINERLKGKSSFWYPFINYLPAEIQTLYNYPDNTPIHEGASTSLIDEIQLKEDDIMSKIVYDRQVHQDNKNRFLNYLRRNQERLREMQGHLSDENGNQVDIVDLIDDEMFDWAWMNVGTRCFGTYHVPGDIAMVPLLDLMNHSIDDEKLGYFVYPIALNIKMLERSDTDKINKELEQDYLAEIPNHDDYDATLEWESQDFDQHWDDYGDRYYNYLPKEKVEKYKVIDSDDEEEQDEDKYIQLDPLEKIWDLNDNKIFFGKRLLSKDSTEIKEGEELNLCYGERANSFLIIEYGFTLPNNRYDFVRPELITIDSVVNLMNEVHTDHQLYHTNLNEFIIRDTLRNKYKLKDKIRVDIKLSGLHRDLLRYLRCFFSPNYKTNKLSPHQEVQTLELYKTMMQNRLDKYPSSIMEDRLLLAKVQDKTNAEVKYHWMYEYVLIYRIGQKEILNRQIQIINEVQEAIMQNKEGDFKQLGDKLKRVCSSNTMLDYIDELKDAVDFLIPQ
ncbi:UNKNOWN [Stylonychia lemnae]|uniref:Rubisco LSMT substrate-binding domain-containing protein n=1 Tax=Stylonychia lemnae TaxID=5949 RepID=A0A078AZW0_STYLE|nr:UNKNOWN [Stylonychia lemnae]|eukprot:CDW87774.1 UNKNOWN [Stylonychia lemnae]